MSPNTYSTNNRDTLSYLQGLRDHDGRIQKEIIKLEDINSEIDRSSYDTKLDAIPKKFVTLFNYDDLRLCGMKSDILTFSDT